MQTNCHFISLPSGSLSALANYYIIGVACSPPTCRLPLIGCLLTHDNNTYLHRNCGWARRGSNNTRSDQGNIWHVKAYNAHKTKVVIQLQSFLHKVFGFCIRRRSQNKMASFPFIVVYYPSLACFQKWMFFMLSIDLPMIEKARQWAPVSREGYHASPESLNMLPPLR